MHFLTCINTVNLNIFHNHNVINRFARKLNKIYEEMKDQQVNPKALM